MRALVIDDTLAVRMLNRRVLESMGWTVEEAADGSIAYDAIKANPTGFDLALVDWHMPKMSGIELITALSDEALCPDTKLVMVTTESEMSSIDNAFDHGVERFLSKPYKPEQLREMVNALFPK